MNFLFYIIYNMYLFYIIDLCNAHLIIYLSEFARYK